MSKIHIFFFMKDIRRIFVRIIKIKYISSIKVAPSKQYNIL